MGRQVRCYFVNLGFVGVGLFYVWKKGILDWAEDKGDL